MVASGAVNSMLSAHFEDVIKSHFRVQLKTDSEAVLKAQST